MQSTVRRLVAALTLMSGSLSYGGLHAAPVASSPLPAVTGYADLAALGLAAPTVLRVTIEKADRIDPSQAADVRPGNARLLISAATTAAIVAPGEVPAHIEYLWDTPLDARGKLPKLKGADALVFLRGGAGQFALISAHGQVAWSPATDARLRGILTEARQGTVPIVTGVTSGFHVAGAVPGEAESQFFLATRDGKPVSLVVLTRPGEPQHLSVALGDVIDEAAAGVKPNTLLWYRLACFLPKELPAAIGNDPDVAGDYRFVLASLGPCGRTL